MCVYGEDVEGWKNDNNINNIPLYTLERRTSRRWRFVYIQTYTFRRVIIEEDTKCVYKYHYLCVIFRIIFSPCSFDMMNSTYFIEIQFFSIIFLSSYPVYFFIICCNKKRTLSLWLVVESIWFIPMDFDKPRINWFLNMTICFFSWIWNT